SAVPCSTCPSASCRSAGSRPAACSWPPCRRAVRCWPVWACTSWPQPSRDSASAAGRRAPPGGRRSRRPGGTTRSYGPPCRGGTSLFFPYAPRDAGLLFASAALGMLIGDTLTGRFVPARWRGRLGAPLRLLLAAPYLVFAVHPALPIAVAAVVLASIGYSASLL